MDRIEIESLELSTEHKCWDCSKEKAICRLYTQSYKEEKEPVFYYCKTCIGLLASWLKPYAKGSVYDI